MWDQCQGTLGSFLKIIQPLGSFSWHLWNQDWNCHGTLSRLLAQYYEKLLTLKKKKKKKRSIILFYCVYVWGWGVCVSARFLEARKGLEPLGLEAGRGPHDMGVGNQIHVLCKSRACSFFVLFCFFWVFFWHRVSLYSPDCPRTHSVDQAGLELRNPPASASRELPL